MSGSAELEALGMGEMPREDRLPYGGLTSAEIDQIAEKAAKRALEHVYAEVGKSVVRKAVWIIGIIVFSLICYLAGKNALRAP